MEILFSVITAYANRIFLFDRAQYEFFHPYNPDNIYHLPLATNAERMEIALNGYEKAAKHHTYEVRLAEMIRTLYQYFFSCK